MTTPHPAAVSAAKEIRNQTMALPISATNEALAITAEIATRHYAPVLEERDELQKLATERASEILRLEGMLDAKRDRIAELEAQLKEALAWSEEDEPLPEDAAIEAAHPSNMASPTKADWHRWNEALRMVSKKRSKYALVDLVNWALTAGATEGRSDQKL